VVELSRFGCLGDNAHLDMLAAALDCLQTGCLIMPASNLRHW
jgi:hypothetical protein